MSFRLSSLSPALASLLFPAIGLAQANSAERASEPVEAKPTPSATPVGSDPAPEREVSSVPSTPATSPEAPQQAATSNNSSRLNASTLQNSIPSTTDIVDSTPPSPSDTLAGHFVAALGGGWIRPHGKLGTNAIIRDSLAHGYRLHGDLSLGISRYVALGVYTDYEEFSAATGCDECSASSLGIGAQARYHLVQGTRFDPWISAGSGYRTFSIETPDSDDTMTGVDVLSLTVGGDWFASPALGVGPLVNYTASVFADRPAWAGGAELAWSVSFGARVVVDRPGK